jgi:hypothetical protein
MKLCCEVSERAKIYDSPICSQIFFSTTLPAHSEPRPLIQFRIHFSQTVGLLGRVISSSQGRYLYTGQHKQNKRIHTPNIHSLSGIRTHNPSIRTNEDSSCHRPRGYCDRHVLRMRACFYQVSSNFVMEWVTLLCRTREVLDINLSPESGNPYWGL